MQAGRPQFEVVPHDLPRRRIHGKTAPVPSLQAMRKGGEEVGGSDHDQWKLEVAQIAEEDLAVWQHHELCKMVQDDAAELSMGNLMQADVACLMRLTAEIKILEEKLSGIEEEPNLRKLEAEPEVLQTHTISQEEVKANLSEWIEPFRKEVETLTSGPVTRLSAKAFQELKQRGLEVEVLPMKTVATVKLPGKKKGRVVVCGNYANEKDDGVSAGGICAVALRGALHGAALRGWTVGTIDVKAEFLQAPRRWKEKISITQPLSILKTMGLVEEGEVWQVNMALYGYVESPADWANHRDWEGLRKMTWEKDGKEYRVVPSPEPHLWKVIDQEQKLHGMVLVYVDDFLVMGDSKMVEQTLDKIEATWTCSDREMINTKTWTRYCGFEVKAREGGGFLVRQTSYLTDVPGRREVKGKETAPLPKIIDADDEEPPTMETLKRAQGYVGELMWVSVRSRPDISYGVGLLSRLLHRRPAYVCELAEHMLRFLNATADKMMVFLPEGEVSSDEVGVYVDASFAPPHEKYRSVQGVVVTHKGSTIMWSSSRQSFVTMSTAEAELLGYSEGHQVAESTKALLSILELPMGRTVLYGDNRAAISLATAETGPWRTRHLRLRASKLREILREAGVSWAMQHLEGSELVADGGRDQKENKKESRFENTPKEREAEHQVRKMTAPREAKSQC